MIEVKNDTLKIVREGEVVQIEAYGRDIIRVRTAVSEIYDISWTLLEHEPVSIDLVKDEDEYVLCNGKIAVKVTKDGKISFWNNKEKLLFKEFWRNERDLEARVIKGRPGNLFYIEQSMDAERDEHFLD